MKGRMYEYMNWNGFLFLPIIYTFLECIVERHGRIEKYTHPRAY